MTIQLENQEGIIEENTINNQKMNEVLVDLLNSLKFSKDKIEIDDKSINQTLVFMDGEKTYKIINGQYLMKDNQYYEIQNLENLIQIQDMLQMEEYDLNIYFLEVEDNHYLEYLAYSYYEKDWANTIRLKSLPFKFQPIDKLREEDKNELLKEAGVISSSLTDGHLRFIEIQEICAKKNIIEQLNDEELVVEYLLTDERKEWSNEMMFTKKIPIKGNLIVK